MDYFHCLFAAFAARLPVVQSRKLLILLHIDAFAAFASNARYVRTRAHTYTHTRARTPSRTGNYYRQMRQMRQNRIKPLENIEEKICRIFLWRGKCGKYVLKTAKKGEFSWI